MKFLCGPKADTLLKTVKVIWLYLNEEMKCDINLQWDFSFYIFMKILHFEMSRKISFKTYKFLQNFWNLPHLEEEFSYIFNTFFINLPEMEGKSPWCPFETSHVWKFSQSQMATAGGICEAVLTVCYIFCTTNQFHIKQSGFYFPCSNHVSKFICIHSSSPSIV